MRVTEPASTENSASKRSISFAATHFGTDLLCAAWALLVSSIVYYIIMAYDVSQIEFVTTPNLVIVNYIVFLVSSIIYTIAAIIVLTVSYPTALRKAIQDVLTADTKKMNCIELYFTGNIFLVTSWLIFIGTLPMIIYPIWGLSIGFVTILAGVSYLIFVIFSLIILYLFIIACFPENLARTFEIDSTTFFHDTCKKYCMCCSESNSYCSIYFGKDYIVVLWIIFIVSMAMVIGSIYYVAIDYNIITSYLWLLSSISFALGSYLYAIDSYTITGESTYFYDYCCCCCNCCSTYKLMKKSKRTNSDDVLQDERMPLVQSENLRNL